MADAGEFKRAAQRLREVGFKRRQIVGMLLGSGRLSDKLLAGEKLTAAENERLSTLDKRFREIERGRDPRRSESTRRVPFDQGQWVRVKIGGKWFSKWVRIPAISTERFAEIYADELADAIEELESRYGVEGAISGISMKPGEPQSGTGILPL